MNALRIAIASLLLAFGAGAAASTSDCASATAPITLNTFVRIGGIEQWMTIRGESCANPIVLFLHGGPGNPLSAYGETIYKGWEKDFTIVQWDQRGSGRTFGRNPDTANGALSIAQMTQDGIELSEHVARRLNHKKVYLVGGSWGSVLGVHMAKARPDLFHAYVGVGQMVSYRQNSSSSYAKVTGLARAAGDKETLGRLEALGPPPWSNPRAFGILRRATRVYEAKTSLPAPKSWWVAAGAYASPEAEAEYERGEDYSYIQFVGLRGNGMLSTVDLPKLGRRFEVPIYLVQGAEDLVTTPEVAKAYFETLSAPRKEYVLIARTGHDPNQASVGAVYRILKGDAVIAAAKARRR